MRSVQILMWLHVKNCTDIDFLLHRTVPWANAAITENQALPRHRRHRVDEPHHGIKFI